MARRLPRHQRRYPDGNQGAARSETAGTPPVVAYAVARRIAAGMPDYWDHATRLELAVLAKDEQKAAKALADALANVREPWEPETTARNLRLIREARERRNEAPPWAFEMEEALVKRAQGS